MKPKQWILEKNLNQQELHAINQGATWSILKQTEKAIQFNASTDFGSIIVWCPKSQVEQEEEIIEVDGKKYIARIYYKNHPEMKA